MGLCFAAHIELKLLYHTVVSPPTFHVMAVVTPGCYGADEMVLCACDFYETAS